MNQIIDIFNQMEWNFTLEDIWGYIISGCIVILITFIFQKIIKRIILSLISKLVIKTKHKWDDIFYERGVFHKISHLIPALALLLIATVVSKTYGKIISLAGGIYLSIAVLMLINAVLNAISDILRSHKALKQIPINSYIQVAKILLFIFFGLLLFGNIVFDESFIVAFVGGLGGISAVSLIVFKDTVTGFLAGIVLTANEMIKVGDWIQAPGYHADGEVVDITLNSVKVKNWDNSITTIPPYSLLTNSFINWENMQRLNARRIKRALYLDMASIRRCDGDMIAHLKEKKLLHGDEATEYDHLTNVGVFRNYVENYVKKHPKIRKDLTCMVRQLQSDHKGMPIEIYAFSAITNWIEYEKLQADIIENIIAVVQDFDLKLFQSPTGNDITKISS